MPRNGSGTMVRIRSWIQDAANLLNISSSRMDGDTDDIASELTNSVARDGQSPATADLPMGGFKHTNVAAGSARTQYLQIGQHQDGGTLYGGTVGGTATAITVTLAPAITAYVTGQVYSFKAGASTTGATTVNFNGVGAKNIKRMDAVALVAGDILSGQLVLIEYDGTQFQLLNPYRNNDETPLLLGSMSGTNTITGTTTYPLAAYITGQVFIFPAAGANTGAATLNVNSLGAKAIKRPNGAALVSGDIAASQIVEVIYDGTNMQMQTPRSSNLLSVQRFTGNGTYTPRADIVYAIVEMVGGGGGAGGAGVTIANQATGSGGGGGGLYQKWFWAAPTSQTITIGAAGGGGGQGVAGGTGGTTSVGTLATAPGGSGSSASTSVTSAVQVTSNGSGAAGGTGGTAGTTLITSIIGQAGANTAALAANGAFVVSGRGGNSLLGLGGVGNYSATKTTADPGTGYGAGGSGVANGASQTATTGGDGTAGIVVIYEYGW